MRYLNNQGQNRDEHIGNYSVLTFSAIVTKSKFTLLVHNRPTNLRDEVLSQDIQLYLESRVRR